MNKSNIVKQEIIDQNQKVTNIDSYKSISDQNWLTSRPTHIYKEVMHLNQIMKKFKDNALSFKEKYEWESKKSEIMLIDLTMLPPGITLNEVKHLCLVRMFN